MVKEFKDELKETLDLLKGVAETFAGKNADFKVYPDSQIKVSDKVVGGKVELVGADSKLQAAPDGGYELSDGSKFTVKSGLIQSIEGEAKPAKKPAKKEGEKMDDETSEDMKAAPKEDEKMDDETDVEASSDEAPAEDPLKPINDTISSHTDSIAALASAVAEIKEMLQNVIDNTSKDSSEADAFKKEIVELKDVVLKLAKMPAMPSKTNTSPIVVNEKEQRMNDLAASFARLNK